MAARPNDPKSIPQVATELWELTVAYAKQETVDPIKGLGRYVGFGAAGSLCLSIGVILLAIGLLRVLQTQTGSAFTGNLSWLPYVFTLIALVGLIGRSVPPAADGKP